MIDVSVLRLVVLNLSKINKVNSVRLWHNVSYQRSCWFRINFQFGEGRSRKSGLMVLV